LAGAAAINHSWVAANQVCRFEVSSTLNYVVSSSYLLMLVVMYVVVMILANMVEMFSFAGHCNGASIRTWLCRYHF
jgi:hypothetical protein